MPTDAHQPPHGCMLSWQAMFPSDFDPDLMAAVYVTAARAYAQDTARSLDEFLALLFIFLRRL
jgi:hypothetical protein